MNHALVKHYLIKKLFPLMLVLFFSIAVQASPNHIAYAKVISAHPVYERVSHSVPREHCYIHQVRDDRSANTRTGTIVGGIVGGAIGHAVGSGSENKKIGAAVGTLLGLSVGNDLAKRHHREHHREHYNGYRNVERCETTYEVDYEEKLTGYDVKYRYHGEVYHTRTRQHPGKRLKVAVSVRPIAEY